MVGEILRAPAFVVVPPMPRSVAVVLALEALETKVIVPPVGPSACGLKVTVRGELAPGATDIGNWAEGTAKSPLSTDAAVMLRFPLPA